MALNHLDALVEIKNIGISNKEDILLFSSDRGTMNQIVDADYSNAVSVKVTTIDSLLKHKTPIAMKIDIEGYENLPWKVP